MVKSRLSRGVERVGSNGERVVKGEAQVDWYNEAKTRQAERLHDADVARLLRSARGTSSRERTGVRGQILSWIGGRMVESGRRLKK
jgi:hypothetical protein